MPIKTPTFYIVVPSYNQGHFIGQTITSILQDSPYPVVCIVKDGGSTDATVSMLKKFGKKIIFTSHRDKGQTDALNQGVRQVLTMSKHPQDIFAYLNSDDYYLDGTLAMVAEQFKNHPEAAWLVGDCEIVNDTGRPIQSLIRQYKRWWREILSFTVLLVLNPIPQPAVFMKVTALRKTGLFDQELHYTMDFEYWLRLWKSVGAPFKLSMPLAAFRIHAASKGTTAFKKQFEEQFQVTKKFTQNWAWLLLQKLHNGLIIFAYHTIK